MVADLGASHTTIDGRYRLDEIIDVAPELVPDEIAWEAAAIGTAEECARTLTA
jgi:hypothetical protein